MLHYNGAAQWLHCARVAGMQYSLRILLLTAAWQPWQRCKRAGKVREAT